MVGRKGRKGKKTHEKGTPKEDDGAREKFSGGEGLKKK